ncbi:MAG: hypothetical protein RI563_02410 [Thiohalophilus sp.]|uniref:hypothetical protein n=1 Tax=Thiohalophilus sp. TaxID=3028392 RepID=UPI00286FC67E|nr:hypothetical protein [Thiohalophilus sp.]MDR9435703.1 hypothetical protein [Thiohalophilus sp.]
MTNTRLKFVEYGMIVIGVLLAFIASFEPQLALGYHLHAGILAAGLLPYFVYSLAVTLKSGPLVTLHGIVLLIIHAWMIDAVRFVAQPDYSVSLLIYGPLVLSLVLIPLVVLALRQPWGLQKSG